MQAGGEVELNTTLFICHSTLGPIASKTLQICHSKRNNMKFKLLSLFALLLSGQFAFAQRTVRGTVTDAETSDPLIGATILVKGTTTGTITDVSGAFSLEVPDETTTLSISYTGYKSTVVSIAGLQNVAVPLEAGSVHDEVVVTG